MTGVNADTFEVDTGFHKATAPELAVGLFFSLPLVVIHHVERSFMPVLRIYLADGHVDIGLPEAVKRFITIHGKTA